MRNRVSSFWFLVSSTQRAGGGRDWNAGVPACNAAFFSGVKLLAYRITGADVAEAATLQAGTPAFQSVDEHAGLRETMHGNRSIKIM